MTLSLIWLGVGVYLVGHGMTKNPPAASFGGYVMVLGGILTIVGAVITH